MKERENSLTNIGDKTYMMNRKGHILIKCNILRFIRYRVAFEEDEKKYIGL